MIKIYMIFESDGERSNFCGAYFNRENAEKDISLAKSLRRDDLKESLYSEKELDAVMEGYHYDVEEYQILDS